MSTLPPRSLVLRFDEALYGIKRREADAERYRPFDPIHRNALEESTHSLLLE